MTQRKKIDLLFEIDSEIESIVSDNDMDFCGSWCNVDVLKSMLKTPTYSNSINHLISLIEHRIDTIGIKNVISDESILKLLQKASENGIYIHSYENFMDE